MVFPGPTPRGGVWDTPPTLGLPIEAWVRGKGSMGTALGGSGTPPTLIPPSTPIGEPIFHCCVKRPNFIGPFKSTRNPFWGMSEFSNVQIFTTLRPEW